MRGLWLFAAPPFVVTGYKEMAGTITALRTQKRRKNRVNVYVDDAYAFSVQYALAAELHRGQSLDDEQIAERYRQFLDSGGLVVSDEDEPSPETHPDSSRPDTSRR